MGKLLFVFVLSISSIACVQQSRAKSYIGKPTSALLTGMGIPTGQMETPDAKIFEYVKCGESYAVPVNMGYAGTGYVGGSSCPKYIFVIKDDRVVSGTFKTN